MTDIWPPSLETALGLAAALAVGAAVGAVYFAALLRATHTLLAKRQDAGALLRGFALRLGGVVALVALALTAGAGPEHLVAATVGFTLARQVWRRYASQER